MPKKKSAFLNNLGGALMAMTRNAGTKSAELPGRPAMDVGAPGSAADDVGLWDRIKAGNIDQVGSEAYNRWGQGKADGDAAELRRESQRTSPGVEAAPAAQATDTVSPAEWAALPEMSHTSNAGMDQLPPSWM